MTSAFSEPEVELEPSRGWVGRGRAGALETLWVKGVPGGREGTWGLGLEESCPGWEGSFSTLNLPRGLK